MKKAKNIGKLISFIIALLHKTEKKRYSLLE